MTEGQLLQNEFGVAGSETIRKTEPGGGIDASRAREYNDDTFAATRR